MQCKMCEGSFGNSPDAVVLCEHKEGFVHAGCCVTDCSGDNKPCDHCVGYYEKSEIQ